MYRQDFSAAWMNLGIVLANLNKPLEAQDAYIEALKYRKKYADCYYNMGNLVIYCFILQPNIIYLHIFLIKYLEQNKHDLALNAWSEATNINPYHAVAWSNTLALLYNTGISFFLLLYHFKLKNNNILFKEKSNKL